jgi:3-deoxy-D-manno-octulosonic-acid transferase
VGETSALAPLVKALAASPQAPDVVVSVSTETGFARARDLYDADRAVVRFPLDFTWMVRRFLDDLRPDIVVLAELETAGVEAVHVAGLGLVVAEERHPRAARQHCKQRGKERQAQAGDRHGAAVIEIGEGRVC